MISTTLKKFEQFFSVSRKTGLNFFFFGLFWSLVYFFFQNEICQIKFCSLTIAYQSIIEAVKTYFYSSKLSFKNFLLLFWESKNQNDFFSFSSNFSSEIFVLFFRFDLSVLL